MNIWLIHLGELLPIDGDVRLFRYGMLAQQLVEEGHAVTRWAPTFVHAYKRQRFEEDKSVEVGDHYEIELVYAEGYQKHVSLARLRFHWQVACRFLQRAEEKVVPDIIVTAMPTPATGLGAIRYGQEHNVPVVVDVRDLWPDVYLDIIPRPLRFLVRPLMFPVFHMNHMIFSRASGITAISDSYLHWGLDYARRPKEERDRVFHMGYKREAVSSEQRRAIEDRWLLKGVRRDAFICCFFGTIGSQFDLDTVIEAARLFEGRGDDKQFVVCGDGERLQYYKNKAADLESLIFPGWVDTADLAVLMEWAELGLAPYCKGARMSLPNKPFEYFAGGLPVLSSLHGELETVLERNNCGITYEAGRVGELVEGIQYLQQNPAERQRLARNAQQLFEDRFSADHVYSEMVEYLEQIADGELLRGA